MKQFPQPNFPAQNAWKNMQEILNNEMPVDEKRKKRFAFFWLVGLMILGTGAYLYITKNDNTTINKNITKASNINTSKELVINKSLEINTINSATKNGVITTDNTLAIVNKTNRNEIENNTNAGSVTVSKIHSDTYKKNTFNNKQVSKFNDTKTSNSLFTNTPSFSDIRRMKIVKGEVNINNTNASSASLESTTSTDVSKSSTAIEIKEKNDESELKSITKTPQNTITKSVVKVPKNKNLQALHYGLQWNIVLPQVNSYLNYNAQSQPLTIAIPEFWVSKNLSRKSEISLQLNPYSQYTLKSNNILVSTNYPITISQGTGQNPTTTNYVHTRSLIKAMGVEFTAKYAYKINDKFSVAIGLGNNWLNAAVINEKIKGNSDKVVHDSLYGIAKGFKEWDYLKSSFFVGRLEVLYQFKKVQFGVAFLKPLGNLYSFENTNTNPVNGRLVFRWKIK